MSDRVQRRIKAGLGLTELARLVGCDLWTVRNWENRKTGRSRYERQFEEVLTRAEAQQGPLRGIMLRAAREELGLTMQQLADAAGVSQRTVQEAELHERGTGRTLRQLTAALAELRSSPERTPRARRVMTELRKRREAVHYTPPSPQVVTRTARLKMLRERHKGLKRAAAAA